MDVQVIKLSDAVQPLPRQTTQFVHGVPDSFLAVGAKKSQEPPEPDRPRFARGAYFMGKAVWAKGYTELLDLVENHNKRGETAISLDCYGNGEDLPEVCSQGFPSPHQTPPDHFSQPAWLHISPIVQ